jgi:hypothetical protein
MHVIASGMSVPSAGGSAGASTVEFNVWSLPHGTQIGPDGKTVLWPDGTTTDPPLVVPYTPTHDWTGTRASAAEPEPELAPIPFEVNEAEVPENLVRLDSFKNRREDEPGPGAA